MPAPQASMMKELAKVQFASFGIKLPVDWKQPQGDPAGKQYVRAFKPSQLAAVPSVLPPLFFPATPNKYHVDAADELTSIFTKYIDGVCDAICQAWSQWQTAATLTNVTINGPIAAGGMVAGPPWTPVIAAQAPKNTRNLAKYSNVIANVIGQAWLSYTASLKVPPLPWYPTFAAVPSPMAPPMPNSATPPTFVQMLIQVPLSVSKDVLKTQMITQLADPKAPHHKELFDCIADAFDKCFQTWQKTTMVTNVIGTGPTTFAPPAVPAGPVVGGFGNMTPGGFT